MKYQLWTVKLLRINGMIWIVGLDRKPPWLVVMFRNTSSYRQIVLKSYNDKFVYMFFSEFFEIFLKYTFAFKYNIILILFFIRKVPSCKIIGTVNGCTSTNDLIKYNITSVYYTRFSTASHDMSMRTRF